MKSKDDTSLSSTKKRKRTEDEEIVLEETISIKKPRNQSYLDNIWNFMVHSLNVMSSIFTVQSESSKIEVLSDSKIITEDQTEKLHLKQVQVHSNIIDQSQAFRNKVISQSLLLTNLIY